MYSVGHGSRGTGLSGVRGLGDPGLLGKFIVSNIWGPTTTDAPVPALKAEDRGVGMVGTAGTRLPCWLFGVLGDTSDASSA